jgi:hypothetical protein
MSGARSDRLRGLLRRAAPSSAATLAATLGISQPTVSRELAALGDGVLRLGRARQTRYSLLRPLGVAGRLGARWPLMRIDAAGRAQAVGHLSAAGAQAFVFEPRDAAPALTHGDFTSGWYEGLPWFMDDLRPQGFLGRVFARRVSTVLQLPQDPTRWSDDDVATALLLHGHDEPGDLVLGEAALRQAQQTLLDPPHTIADGEQGAHYPARAEAALQGESVGSSAGGERPKFGVTLQARVAASTARRARTSAATAWRSCIVKFSDRTDTPGGARWADLLRCEHLAAQVLREHGVDAAQTAIVDAGKRCFLEVTRFDRTPTLGRRGLVSLRALDAAFHGHGAIDWWRYAPQLEREDWIGAADAQRLAVLGLFGALIGNDDMHLGNASLVLQGERPMALAPAYDMLPMRFAPTAGGEVVARSFAVLPPSPEFAPAWRHAAQAAVVFWQRVRGGARISGAFKAIAADAQRKVEGALQRLG